jgi:hypothetical protein
MVRRLEERDGKKLEPDYVEHLRTTMWDLTGYELSVPKEFVLGTITHGRKYAGVFEQMKCSLLRPETGYFITSDNPICRSADPSTAHPIYGDHGYLNKTVQVTFPLSPRTMLLMTWEGQYPRVASIERAYVTKMKLVVRAKPSGFFTGIYRTDASSGLRRIIRTGDPAAAAASSMAPKASGPSKCHVGAAGLPTSRNKSAARSWEGLHLSGRPRKSTPSCAADRTHVCHDSHALWAQRIRGVSARDLGCPAGFSEDLPRRKRPDRILLQSSSRSFCRFAGTLCNGRRSAGVPLGHSGGTLIAQEGPIYWGY